MSRSKAEIWRKGADLSLLLILLAEQWDEWQFVCAASNSPMMSGLPEKSCLIDAFCNLTS